MALINCPECGKEISDKAQSCPNCGTPLKENQQQTVNIPYQQQEYVQPKKKKKGHGCLVTIVIFIAIIAVFAIIGSSLSKGSGTSTSTNNGISQANTEQEDQNDAMIPFLQEGQISDDLALVVNEVTETDSISAANGMLAYKPDSGKYAVVNVTIRNTSKESQNLLLNYFKLIGPDDAKYVSTIISVADDKYITVDTINPNLDITGNLVFEIPKDLAASDCVLQYSDFDFSNDISYFNLK